MAERKQIKFEVLELDKDDKTAEAKGRNGYFRPDQIELYEGWFALAKKASGDEKPSLALNVWSKRTDGNPPIVIQLSYSQWAKIAQSILEALSLTGDYFAGRALDGYEQKRSIEDGIVKFSNRTVYRICEGDILDTAEQRGLQLTEDQLADIAHYVENGLDPDGHWCEVINMAIDETIKEPAEV